MPVASTRIKPPRWPVSPGLVAPEWRWAWGGNPLPVHLPMWEGTGPAFPPGYGFTPEAPPKWSIGRYGAAMEFVPTDPVTLINDGGALHFPPPLTMWVLVYMDGARAGSWTGVCSNDDWHLNSDPANPYAGVSIQKNASDEYVVSFADGLGDIGENISDRRGGSFPMDEWVMLHHVLPTAANGGDGIRFFENGVEITSQLSTVVNNVTEVGYTASDGMLGKTDNDFRGMIAGWGMFPFVPTDSQIAQHARDPFGPFKPAL